jgi:hypothetical protein
MRSSSGVTGKLFCQKPNISKKYNFPPKKKWIWTESVKDLLEYFILI